MRTAASIVGVMIAVAAAAAPSAIAVPIADGQNPLPAFIGRPATPSPMFAPDPPRHRILEDGAWRL
jgi:hypothetical protein